MRGFWVNYLMAAVLGGLIAGSLYYTTRDDKPTASVQPAADTTQSAQDEMSSPDETTETALATDTSESDADETAEDKPEEAGTDKSDTSDATEVETADMAAPEDSETPAEEVEGTEEVMAEPETPEEPAEETPSTEMAATDTEPVTPDEAEQTADATQSSSDPEMDTTMAAEDNAGTDVAADDPMDQIEAAADDIFDTLTASDDGATMLSGAADADMSEETAQDESTEDEAENAIETAAAAIDDATSALDDTETADSQEDSTPVVEEPEMSSVEVEGTGLMIEGQRPTFDVVRVDNSGMAVIAGTAEPGSVVSIMADGEKIGEATADASGEFVAILTANNTEAQNLELESELDGELAFSDESILILPTIGTQAANDVVEEIAPTIVRATDDEVVVIQPGGPPLVDQIVIDAVSYDEAGDKVFVSGRGTPENEVFLYVNNEAVANTMIGTDGTWDIELRNLDVGIYNLRADELDETGRVTSRMETPFQRAYPADVQAAAQATTEITHIVQPGNSLWLIATNNYGDGFKYHQIFQANRDKIRDPDLIYPGQVFVIPGEE